VVVQLSISRINSGGFGVVYLFDIILCCGLVESQHPVMLQGMPVAAHVNRAAVAALKLAVLASRADEKVLLWQTHPRQKQGWMAYATIYAHTKTTANEGVPRSVEGHAAADETVQLG
jgi:hypothetical protein